MQESCIKDYTGREKKKLLEPDLLKKQVGGLWGAIMAVENGCPYVVLSKLLCLAPFFLNFTLSF